MTVMWPRTLFIFLASVVAGVGIMVLVDPGLPSYLTKRSLYDMTTQSSQPSIPNRASQSVNKQTIHADFVDPYFDAQPVASSMYRHIQVVEPGLNRENQSISQYETLNASKEPVLFEAYWCPHCQRTLKLLVDNASKLDTLPIFVQTGFPKGITLHQADQIGAEEARSLRVSGNPIAFMLGNTYKQYVKGYPTLVFPYHGKIMMLSGEHTLGVWEQALNVTN